VRRGDRIFFLISIRTRFSNPLNDLPSAVNEIIARYLKAVGDPREVVSDPEARYWGGRVEERSLVPLGEARLGRISIDEWLRRSQAAA
jgi:hypothetical protein